MSDIISLGKSSNDVWVEFRTHLSHGAPHVYFLVLLTCMDLSLRHGCLFVFNLAEGTIQASMVITVADPELQNSEHEVGTDLLP